MQTNKLIFIGGLHRSGTSLLHQILRSHHQVSGFVNTGVPEDEGQHLQNIYLPAKSFGGPGYFGLNPDSCMNENHALATHENASMLFSQWSKHWNLSKPYLVEKSPPNIVRTRFLQKLFPNSYFINLLRHPIAVAMATQKWTNSDLNHLIEHGLTCYERLAADTPYLNHSFTLHYESLVNLPERSIAEISHWAGLEDFVFEKLIRSDLNDHYFNTWLSTPLIEREETIEKFEHRANRFGYSLKEKSPLTNSIKLPEF